MTTQTDESDEKVGRFSDRHKDLIAGLVVSLVALPLCLGIALASGVPLFSGLLAGIIGGIVVGAMSGSSTSVSGPAAGLTAVVLAQVANLGSFEAFLLALVIGGILQIILGVVRAGELSAFFPSSVVKGLLAAIGVILIMKQIPHLFGDDNDPEGDMSYEQPDSENTFTEIWTLVTDGIHYGAATIGIASLLLLVIWNRTERLKKSILPGPLVVVLLGVSLQLFFQRFSGDWSIGGKHLVDIPIADFTDGLAAFFQNPKFFRNPDFSQLRNPSIYMAGLTIAIVASLETLLNLEAVDKLDVKNRKSPANRELIAQGTGNIVSGLIGGLPITSVIVRGSVNVNSGAKTKLSAIFHGVLLFICVIFLPVYLNMIPLSALAAILLVTGFKLANPKLFRQMWKEGRYQFVPFMVTLLSIVFTDLLVGTLIGLGVSLLFILNSNLRKPIRQILETHLDGDVLHIELSNQVSFLNRAALTKVLYDAKPGTNLLIDASGTDYIDPDILSLIKEFKDEIAPTHHVAVSLRGFRKTYQLKDDIQYADYSTQELKSRATPEQVLELLREGNQRFYTSKRLTRDFNRQVTATANGQYPLAAVLSCIDSRVPTELVFDSGIGDIFSVRVAGNIIGTKSLGSLEYAAIVSGVKLIVVLGHTRCGAVTASVQFMCDQKSPDEVTGCSHLSSITDEINRGVELTECVRLNAISEEEKERFIDDIAERNVQRTVQEIVARSEGIEKAVTAGELMVVGALYDVKSGRIEFLDS